MTKLTFAAAAVLLGTTLGGCDGRTGRRKLTRITRSRSRMCGMSAVRTVVGGGRTITGTTGTTTMRTHRAIGITAVIGTEIAD